MSQNSNSQRASRNVLNGRADMPRVSVSAMDCVSAGYRFIVTLNTFTFGFQTVSGIKLDRDREAVEEGGVNEHVVYVGKPERQEETLEFERGLLLRAPSLASSALRAAATLLSNNLARRTALVGIASLDPQEALEYGPAFGTIDVYSPSMQKTACYTFTSLGMKNWELSGGLDANKSELMIERISIYHHGLVRRPVTTVPSIISGALEGVAGAASAALDVGNVIADIALAPKKIAAAAVDSYTDFKETIDNDITDKANKLKGKFESLKEEYTTFETEKDKEKRLEEESKIRDEEKKIKDEAVDNQVKKVEEAKEKLYNAETEEEKAKAQKDLKRETAELERLSKAPAEEVAKEVAQEKESLQQIKNKTEEQRKENKKTAENKTQSARETAKKIISDAANGTESEKALAEAAGKDLVADALEDEANVKDLIAKAYEEEAAKAEQEYLDAAAEEMAAKQEYMEAMKSGDPEKVSAAKEKLDKATKDKDNKVNESNAAKEKAENARAEAEESESNANDARAEAEESTQTAVGTS